MAAVNPDLIALFEQKLENLVREAKFTDEETRKIKEFAKQVQDRLLTFR